MCVVSVFEVPDRYRKGPPPVRGTIHCSVQCYQPHPRGLRAIHVESSDRLLGHERIDTEKPEMSPPNRIYVDLDDVLCRTARGFLEVLEREFGKKVAYEEIASFDLGRSFGLGPHELKRFMRLAHQPEVLLKLAPVEGAIEALAAWKMAGYELTVVTGRPPATESVSQEWLDHNQVPHDALRFVDKYGRADSRYPGSFATPLRELADAGFRLAVEDSLHTAEFLAGPLAIPVLLMERPWNRDKGVGPSDGIVRCRNWQEVMERFPHP